MQPLGANESTIYFYICWRFQSDMKCTFSTIKAEINAIQSWHADNCYHISVLSWKPIVRLLNGFRKLRPSKSNTKDPLSTDEFSVLLNHLPGNSHDAQLLRAALCWEQNGFARSAEYTVKSNNLSKDDLKRIISLYNLRFGSNKDGSHTMIYEQYYSKSNQFNSKESVLFSCRCPCPCAIKEVKALLRWRKINRTSDYLFRFSNGKFLTYSNVNNVLKNLCQLAGLEPALFATHSLRKGAAVDAINEGIDLVQVMRIGRWKSINGFKHYTLLNNDQLCQLRRDKFFPNDNVRDGGCG